MLRSPTTNQPIARNNATIFLALIMLFSACGTKNKEFFVSLQGHDENDGSQQFPFATLEQAKIAAGALLTEEDQKKVTIMIEPGEYKIQNPILFDFNDFGRNNKELIIKSNSKDRVIVSGGLQLKNWQKLENDIWAATLPKTYSHDYVRELFLDNRRMIRSRHPNQGYLRVKQVGSDNRTHFYFEKNDFPIPASVPNTELILLHDWSISRITLLDIDRDEDRITTVDSIGAKVLEFFGLDNWEKQPRYFLENDFRFIDQDYEWSFDTQTRKIFIKMPPGTSIEDHQIIIPFCENLITLTGTMETPIRNIHFEGITFRYCAWGIPRQGYAGIQATFFDPRPNQGKGWSVVPAAIYATFADSCTFQNCHFENLGGSGIWLETGVTNSQIRACHFIDISANGIMIGEGQDRMVGNVPWWQSAPQEAAKNNKIINCEIQNCGVQYFGAVGLWSGLTENTQIEENEIYNLPYTGISIGWMWDTTATPSKNNLISGNHIHHVMQKLSDGGGIYMLGLQPGSKLMNNLIHDVTVNAGRAESNGMFLDEGITDVVVAENIIYNIAKSPIRFHRATSNIVRDNILFCNEGIPAFTYNRTDSNLIKRIDNQIYHPSDEFYEKELRKVRELQK